MKLIVGLGNPGKEYEKTRHNIGFMILDEFAKKEKLQFASKSKFKGQIVNTIVQNEAVILLKPTTYMNNSGEAVLAVKQFYNINNEDIFVIYDDLDLPCGKVRIRQKGSSGGHKGIKSIIRCINDENFHRLKVGIDRIEKISVIDYVLGKFTPEQIVGITKSINTSLDVIYDWLKKDIVYVMNKYN